MSHFLLLTLIGVLTFNPLGHSAAQQLQTNPIRILAQDEANDFPRGLTFSLSVESNVAITDADLYYQLPGSSAPTWISLEFSPGTRVDLSYTWDTSSITVTPSQEIRYYWELGDRAGNRLVTETRLIAYDDIRFEWDELADSSLRVRWYEGGDDFGRLIFETGQRALLDLQRFTQTTLEKPITLLVYANSQDFASWHSYVDDWVGGQAFPDLGITALIVPAYSNENWILNVVPHELAHLYFYSVYQNSLSNWPSWLDEGVAQLFEYGQNPDALVEVRAAAAQGELVPLAHLNGSFGREASQVRLAYAESLSLILFILEEHGTPGMLDLFNDLAEGKTTRQAVEASLGVSWEQFEAAWLTWLGAPATPKPPPTPWPTAAFIMMSTAAPAPTRAPSTPTPPPVPTGEARWAVPGSLLAGIAVLLAGLLGLWLLRRARLG